jgi:hypothetical protein
VLALVVLVVLLLAKLLWLFAEKAGWRMLLL